MLNLDVRGASCLAYQRQFGVEENSRDLAFFAADQPAIYIAEFCFDLVCQLNAELCYYFQNYFNQFVHRMNFR